MYAQQNAGWAEGHFPVEGLRPKNLEQLGTEVQDLADHLGQLITAVHRRSVTFPKSAGVLARVSREWPP